VSLLTTIECEQLQGLG